MINDVESDTYKEPKERNLRVMYKLKVSKDLTSKICPMKKSLMMTTMSQLKKRKQQYEDPPILINKIFFYVYILVYRKLVIF